MDGRDRQAIEALFDRLAEVERRSPPRDAEAAALIRASVSQQPASPYYMAQTIVVQQQALEAAEQRIAQLERAGSGGGLFGGIFGDDRRQPESRADRARAGNDAQPWGNRGGGGFLAGAAQTAVGVAGGVLLGNMLAGALFGGSEAQASEAEPDDPAADDVGDDFDAGGDFGGDF